MWNPFKKKAMSNKHENKHKKSDKQLFTEKLEEALEHKKDGQENTEEQEQEEEKERSFYSLTHDEVNGLLMKVLQYNTHALQELQKAFKFNEHHIVNKTIDSNNLLMKKMENE